MGIEVTKENPCAHCGKPDYCYRIEPKSVCNRDHSPAHLLTAKGGAQ